MSVTYELTDGVGLITNDAPPLNILTRAVLSELRAHLQRAAAEPSLRVLLLSATGKHFSAGASVAEHLPPDFETMLPEFVETIVMLDAFPLPVVASVQGRCLGGAFELVQAADMIIASENAQFGQPEIVLGVYAPVACALLPRRMAPALAAELLFTGENCNVYQLADAGLVNRVVPNELLPEESLSLGARIARHSATSLRALKAAMRSARDRTTRDAIDVATRHYITDLMSTHDALEGLHAFTEKRIPQWSHQ